MDRHDGGLGRVQHARPKKNNPVHPLAGADWTTLLNVLAENGGVSTSKLGKLLPVLGSVLGRSPCSLLEKIGTLHLEDEPFEHPPVFIIGHWRSGTTHLYNILAKSPMIGYVPPLATGLPWDMLGIARVFRPLLERALPSERFIDRVPVNPDSPQEDEIALASMTHMSFYHGIYFPERLQELFDRGIFFDGATEADIEDWNHVFLLYLKKLQVLFPGRQLFIKNPVYTARVAHIRKLIPNAKFIHIHRNPYIVFQSMRNFWNKLLREFALQDECDVDIDELILGAYPRMMDLAEKDCSKLPEGDFVQMSYEDLEKDPLGQIRNILQGLNLDHYAEGESWFRTYLASVKSYKKNSYDISDEDNQKVYSRWSGFINQWNYLPPC